MSRCPYLPVSRRDALKLGLGLPLALSLPGLGLWPADSAATEHYLKVRDQVADPTNLEFTVQYPGNEGACETSP